jgi:hypothetical protein
MRVYSAQLCQFIDYEPLEFTGPNRTHDLSTLLPVEDYRRPPPTPPEPVRCRCGRAVYPSYVARGCEVCATCQKDDL